MPNAPFLRTTLLAGITACALIGSVQAGDLLTSNYSTPAVGTDAWTSYMGMKGMFLPHGDNCDTSEAFISFSPNGEGICIETSERSAALWVNARQDCLDDGKRLPEPGEWLVACYGAANYGLSSMTNNDEWASNFAKGDLRDDYLAIAVPALGRNRCDFGTMGKVAINGSNTAESKTYRCAH